MMAQPDMFEDVLNLEEQYYREGYDLGVADGSRSGRIEGRVFGLEKGFEKFLEMGTLNGKATVWQARLPSNQSDSSSMMPSLSGNQRIRKHIDRLATLTDLEGISTENSEDAVSEFDDRLKDAKAKATLITRVIGEDEASNAGGEQDQTRGKVLRLKRNAAETGVAGRKTGEMEDFAGLPNKS